jgi:hypothetical protein
MTKELSPFIKKQMTKELEVNLVGTACTERGMARTKV